MKKLKTAEQAVLTTIGQLGHGNVHQIAEASGYARSTADKAIKVLADAGLITEFDTGADPAEGAPTQWQLTGDEASAPIGTGERATDDTNLDADLDAESTMDDPTLTAGHDSSESVSDDSDADNDAENFDDEDFDEDDADDDFDEHRDEDQDEAGDRGGDSSRKPSNQRVLMIAGAMVAFPGGATIAQLHTSTNIPEKALDRLLVVMVSGGAAVLLHGVPRRWKNGTADPAAIDPFPPVPRCAQCQRVLPAGWTPDALTEPEQGAKAPDQKVLMLAGAMFAHTDGATAAQLAADSRLTPEMVARLLPAMETAGVAVRVTTAGSDGNDGEQTGEPLWILKPGPLHTVDPEPKCPGCGRPQPGARSSRNTPAGTRRADALPRNVLRDATLQFVLARPGIVLSPGAIASALAVELNRDVVSPGAVKNNCEGFAAEGKILLVSSPATDGKQWLFSTLPAQDATDSDAAQPQGGTDGNSGEDAAA